MQKNWRSFVEIYGNIEGARDGFENACQTLFTKIYPRKYVAKMAVKQGDGGIDICIGELGVEPITVVQCKFFLETFSDSQKSQIRDSFDRAIKSDKYELKEWILCIPREIDIDETSWWAKWKKKKIEEYSKESEFIKVKNGINLIDLMKEHNIYNQIFQMEDSLKIDSIDSKLDDIKALYNKDVSPSNKKKIICDEVCINSSHIIYKDGYIEPRTVNIEEFDINISVCPVTVEEYHLFCKSTNIKMPYGNNLKKNKRPVINIDWNQAQKYCKWLQEKTTKVYRLPTSKEWESIALLNMPDNDLEEYIVCREDFKKNPKIAKVGTKKAGKLNIFDMPGNIYEWCLDNLNDGKVIKGSTFNTSLKNIDICKNESFDNFYSNSNLGFRVVL